MTTEDFIDLLEERRLAPAGVARQLRAKAAQGDDRITPKAILKFLVKKEIVTRAQAKEILETTLVVSDKAESSILGLVPLPKSATSKPPAAESVAPPSPRERKVAPTPEQVAPLSAAGDVGFDPFTPVEEEVDPLLEESAAEAKKGAKGAKKKKRKRSSKRGENEWDSPLLLIGGGVLALLLIGGYVIYYLLTRENADELLKVANSNFDSGSYSQSISDYQKFVKNFPAHKDISQARVRLGMAELWRDTERTTNFAGALETAKRVINQIEDEPAFTTDGSDEEGLSQAKRELSSLLTTIAKGLTEQADSSEDNAVIKERITQTNEVLALTANTKYVPQRFRQDSELSAVRETLARVEARQQRGADLEAALEKMETSIAGGDPAAAFAVRKELIHQYPALMNDASLAEKVLKIAAAEQAIVKFVEDRQSATTSAPETPIVAELALADRRGATAAGASGPIVVRVDGGLYGLNAGDGSLLWRRFVGRAVRSYPLVLASGNVVAADAQQQELVCLNAETGALVWRLPLEGNLATPVALGDRLLVASDAGRVYLVEQARGDLLGYVEMSQPIKLPPLVNAQGDRVYVVGDHSNVYTLSGNDLACLGVYYLGHSAGGVAAPPLLALNKLIVADNSGAETCQVRVLSLNEQQTPTETAASFRMTGLVTTPLQSAGRRFAAVTSKGQAVVFEVSGANDKSSLTALATRDSQDRDQLARYGLLHDGHLWLGARELTKLAILPTGNQLPVRSLDRDYRGDAFDYPLQAIGNFVIHVRRPAGLGGAIVAAMDASASKAAWETAVAVPPAGAPAVDASSQLIVAGSSSGSIYQLDREAMARRVQDQAIRSEMATVKPVVYTDSLDLGSGRLAMGGRGATKILHFRPNDPRQQLREVALPGPLSSSLAPWGEGFVAPTEVGQIFLFGADDATPLATPFQPELVPGKKFNWLTPAAVDGGANSQLAVSDGVTKVYSLRVVDEPEPHLESTAMVDVGPSPLTTRLAAAGATLFAGNEAGKAARYALPDLVVGEPVDLGGRVTWGPFAVGDGVLLATESDELILLNESGAVAWRQPLAHGKLGGRPLVDGETAYLVHLAGGLSSVAVGDGSEGAYLDLGQPATAGPVAFGPRLIVVSSDGTLLVVNRP